MALDYGRIGRRERVVIVGNEASGVSGPASNRANSGTFTDRTIDEGDWANELRQVASSYAKNKAETETDEKLLKTLVAQAVGRGVTLRQIEEILASGGFTITRAGIAKWAKKATK